MQKAVELTHDNLNILASFKELAKVNFEAGKTGFVNIIRVEMTEKETTIELQNLKDQIFPMQIMLQQLINAESPVDISFPETLASTPLLPDTFQLKDSILASNPRLQTLKKISETKDAEYRLAALAGNPGFSLGLTYINVGQRAESPGLAGNGQDAWLLPQVGLQIPIYRKKYTALKNQTTLEKESIALSIENQENQLISQTEMLLSKYRQSIREIALHEEMKDLSERSLSLLQTAFSTGKIDFEEVLRMQRKVLTHQLAREKALAENHITYYEIIYLMGNPL